MNLSPVPNPNQDKTSPYADLAPGSVPALLPSLEACLPACEFKTHILRVPGAMVRVSEYGGQVLEFRVTSPADRAQDVYYMSPFADLTGKGNPIRGGGQLAGWPNFGKGELAVPAFDESTRGKLPAHGLIRVKSFAVPIFSSHRGSGVTRAESIKLATCSGDSDMEKWHPFVCRTEHLLSSNLAKGIFMLTSSVTYTNAAKVSVPIQGFFHNYFAIGDAANIGITGLTGRDYIDVNNLSEGVEELGDRALVNGQDLIGRIYTGCRSATIFDDVLGRQIFVAGGLSESPSKEGESDMVLWNPGTLPPNEGDPKSWKYPFLPHGANNEMLCLESGSRGRLVLPGQSVTISQHIVVDWFQGA